MSKSEFIKKMFVVLYVIVVSILFWSVIKSGYSYRFDSDELFHVQKVYLILQGLKPYQQFYSVYSPVLHWILGPLFLVSGFSVKTISYARALMIVLFALRIFFSFLVVRLIFGRRVGLLFVPLFLLEPFTVFAAMQIRPDNLMLTFYSLFLLIFAYGVLKSSKKLLFLSGLALALTFFTSLKILASLIVIVAVFFVYSLKKRRIREYIFFLNGFILAFVIIFLYFFSNGTLISMFQQVFLDPYPANNMVVYPTPLNFFYSPENGLIYGLGGKTMSWIYAWILPIAAFSGGYKTLLEAINNGLNDKREFLKLLIYLMLVATWASMFFIYSVWIQYFLPLTWVYTLFSAVLIVDILKNSKISQALRKFILVCTVVFFVFLFRDSIIGNQARSKITFSPEIEGMREAWKLVPENATTLPNLLFRRPVYPIIFADAPLQYKIDRYGSSYNAIKKYKPSFLIIDISSLGTELENYIRNNYMQDKKNPTFWLRINRNQNGKQ